MVKHRAYKLKNEMKGDFITKDSEARLYLLLIQDEPAKDRVYESIILFIIKMFFAFSVSYFTAIWAIQEAYNERGYEAYGGEYLLIIAVFIFAYKAINIFFKHFRRGQSGKKRDKNNSQNRNS